MMKNFLERLRMAWNILWMESIPAPIVVEDKMVEVLSNMRKEHQELLETYVNKAYNIIEMGIPNEKSEVMRRGVRDVFQTMIDGMFTRTMARMEEINTLLHTNTNEPNTEVRRKDAE